jgi:hypothetical protein
MSTSLRVYLHVLPVKMNTGRPVRMERPHPEREQAPRIRDFTAH